MAIALKRRVVVLQAVEHAQLNEGNPFEGFVRTLQADQKNVDKLDNDIAHVLRQLASLQLDRSHGVRGFAFRAADVDKLLQTSDRLRDLGDRVPASGRPTDVAIEIARESDGSIVVSPAIAG
ncbi:hypothetical protein [Gordonia sp. DT101]|uniref:hypothetical protein n=1 Tax=Gordonia sp. DT101 TaxID=3416545 RepID=UPI003CF2B681